MHITAIERFLHDNPDIEKKKWTTSDVNREIVKNACKDFKSTVGYIKKFVGQGELVDDKQCPYVSTANVFVSHAWKYTFYDVVYKVMRQYADRHEDVYFWFDLFTNNQHVQEEKDGDWYKIKFKSSIESIGKVLLIMYPWYDPQPVKRAWCLFEIAITLSSPQTIDFEIDMPSEEAKKLAKEISDQCTPLIKALSTIQAEKASAKTAEDREMIFSAIRSFEGGFALVNEQVKKKIREWYVKEIEKLANDKHSFDPELNLTVADVLRALGDFNKAFAYCKTCVEFLHHGPSTDHQAAVSDSERDGHAVIGIKTTVPKARIRHQLEFSYGGNGGFCDWLTQKIFHRYFQDTYLTMALICEGIGKYRDALEYNQELLRDLKANPLKDCVTLGKAYNNIAGAYRNLGDLKSSMENYQKSLRIKETFIGKKTIAAANTRYNISHLYLEAGDFDKALEYTQQALRIYLKRHGSKHDHPDLAKCYRNIGVIHYRRRLGNEDWAYLDKALQMQLKTTGEQHPHVAVNYNDMGQVLREKGDFQQSIEYHGKALSIFTRAYGEMHRDVGVTQTHLGDSYRQQGEFEQAKNLYAKSLSTLQEVLEGGHPLIGETRHKRAKLMMQAQAQPMDILTELEETAVTLWKTKAQGAPAMVSINDDISVICAQLGSYDRCLVHLLQGSVLTVDGYLPNERNEHSTSKPFDPISIKSHHMLLLLLGGSGNTEEMAELAKTCPFERVAYKVKIPSENTCTVKKGKKKIAVLEKQIREKATAIGWDNLEVAKLYNHIGDTYSQMANASNNNHMESCLQQSRDYHSKALETLELLQDEEQTAREKYESHRKLGELEYRSGNVDKALESFNECLKLCKTENGTTYDALAEIYTTEKNFEKALTSLLESLRIKKKRFVDRTHSRVLGAHDNLALVYTYMANHVEALRHYLQGTIVEKLKTLGKHNTTLIKLHTELRKYLSKHSEFEAADEMFLSTE